VNIVRVGELLRLPQRLVESANRRSAVAGDETGGIESAVEVALMLQYRQAHQGFDAGHVGAALVQRIFIVEGYLHNTTRPARGNG
jgi:hypothetical protein